MDDNKNKLSIDIAKEKIKDVFDRWEANLWNGIWEEAQKEMLEEVLDCLNV